MKEVRQRQIAYDITCTWNKKNDTNDLIYKTEIDTQRKQTYGYQRGKREKVDKLGVCT